MVKRESLPQNTRLGREAFAISGFKIIANERAIPLLLNGIEDSGLRFYIEDAKTKSGTVIISVPLKDEEDIPEELRETFFALNEKTDDASFAFKAVRVHPDGYEVKYNVPGGKEFSEYHPVLRLNF